VAHFKSLFCLSSLRYPNTDAEQREMWDWVVRWRIAMAVFGPAERG